MNALDEWMVAACGEVGVDPAEVDTALVLDLAKDVAHVVVRPGAPVTAYLLGLAVGRGADPAAGAARLNALARSWAPDTGDEATTR